MPHLQGTPRIVHLVPQVLPILQGARPERLGILGPRKLRHLQLLQRPGPASIRRVLHEPNHPDAPNGFIRRNHNHSTPNRSSRQWQRTRQRNPEETPQKQQLPKLATTSPHPSTGPHCGHSSALVHLLDAGLVRDDGSANNRQTGLDDVANETKTALGREPTDEHTSGDGLATANSDAPTHAAG